MTNYVMLDSTPYLQYQVPLANRGKVRDNYDLSSQILMVTTDRVSTFDVVHPDGIPDKGLILAQMCAFWFQKPEIRAVCRNHFIELVGTQFKKGTETVSCPQIAGRAMLVEKADSRFSAEFIVRGYLAGSGWAEYQKSRTVNGVPLPGGLVESQQLPEPIFTPSTKANTGHDEPLTPKQYIELIGGPEMAAILRDKSLALYKVGAAYALSLGIIIADTKFEFGMLNGEPIVIDEILTPDSSRFWDLAKYTPGSPQDSADKQYVRDWAAGTGWDKNPPAPELPPEVITETARRYREIFTTLTGMKLRYPSE